MSSLLSNFTFRPFTSSSEPSTSHPTANSSSSQSIGHRSASNSRFPRPPPPPTLIGDQEEAIVVSPSNSERTSKKRAWAPSLRVVTPAAPALDTMKAGARFDVPSAYLGQVEAEAEQRAKRFGNQSGSNALGLGLPSGSLHPPGHFARDLSSSSTYASDYEHDNLHPRFPSPSPPPSPVADMAEGQPPTKKRRGFGEALLSSAIDAAVFSTAVGYAAYQLWKNRGINGQDDPESSKSPDEIEDDRISPDLDVPPPPAYEEVAPNPMRPEMEEPTTAPPRKARYVHTVGSSKPIRPAYRPHNPRTPKGSRVGASGPGYRSKSSAISSMGSNNQALQAGGMPQVNFTPTMPNPDSPSSWWDQHGYQEPSFEDFNPEEGESNQEREEDPAFMDLNEKLKFMISAGKEALTSQADIDQDTMDGLEQEESSFASTSMPPQSSQPTSSPFAFGTNSPSRGAFSSRSRGRSSLGPKGPPSTPTPSSNRARRPGFATPTAASSARSRGTPSFTPSRGGSVRTTPAKRQSISGQDDNPTRQMFGNGSGRNQTLW